MDPSSDTNPVDRGLNNHFTGSASFLMEMSTGRGEGSQFSLESPLRASLDDSSVERLEDSHHVLQKWANDGNFTHEFLAFFLRSIKVHSRMM